MDYLKQIAAIDERYYRNFVKKEMKTTFYKKYKSCKKWQNKARVIQLYHAYMIVKNGKFSLRQVASYFDLSLGNVCEAIKLADNMPIIKDCLTRKEALSKIK